MYYAIVYFIIGVIVCIYSWKTEYEDDYQKTKESGECEDSMAIMLMLFLIVFWPVKVISILYKKINDKRRQNKS